ncbi:DnaJ domain-containing protein [candidate division FCPU426 bacterium]|nr:DnaJ domain-containing protein [candidate division FCPU426 bacterium]
MTNKAVYYLWFAAIILYLVSPWDLHPTLLDDLLVFGIYLAVLFYQMNKIAKNREAHRQSKQREHQSGEEDATASVAEGPLTLQKAYRLLGVTPAAAREEIRRAFRERVAQNHPDKVSHLSPELRERAHELTVLINRAYTMIKQHKKI